MISGFAVICESIYNSMKGTLNTSAALLVYIKNYCFTVTKLCTLFTEIRMALQLNYKKKINK